MNGPDGPAEPVHQPGDAAARAFEEIRKERRGGPQQPTMWAVLSIGLILVGAIIAFAVVSDRTIRVPRADYILDEPELDADDASGLAVPEDLGSVPELTSLIDWPAGEQPLRFEGSVTAVWFKRVGSCTTCWMNSRYWQQLFLRYWPSGLQVISVVDVDPTRLQPDDAIWSAVADPGGDAARAFVSDVDVPADYVVVVDRNGHARYAAEGKPTYEGIEAVVAKLLWDDE